MGHLQVSILAGSNGSNELNLADRLTSGCILIVNPNNIVQEPLRATDGGLAK